VATFASAHRKTMAVLFQSVSPTGLSSPPPPPTLPRVFHHRRGPRLARCDPVPSLPPPGALPLVTSFVLEPSQAWTPSLCRCRPCPHARFLLRHLELGHERAASPCGLHLLQLMSPSTSGSTSSSPWAPAQPVRRPHSQSHCQVFLRIWVEKLNASPIWM
jgi:hypothetical protein